ncbi:CHASE domain-containing protein [Marinobacter sp. 2_MG-2023]|uniref:CHASE domain-containing protein n=1 Tax=Marinobacter sp. 2_MG-2023 TaxID=3062679 RepID=UPI0026E2071A|nr:CHASE domain-containing protein [Marinobacter sp. 2_MG-2023]MDO6443378.1 CHASE domain-containing protein [Marinobacter sp. 2_MG-2023]
MTKIRGAVAELTKLHWVVVGLSLLLTIVAWQVSAQIADARAEDQFERRIQQLNGLLLDRMQKYEFALISGVSTIRVNDEKVTLEQWRRFAEALAVQDRLPGVAGIGVISRVPENGLESYLAEQRKERPDYRVHPPHTGSDFWPITYLEPLAGNEAAIGLDMAHEANRYTAALKAMRTGETQITGPIALVQDDEKTPGFLFFHPFYHTPDAGQELNEETDFLGLVYAPFIVARLMEGTLANTNRLVHVRITDGEQQLYSEFSETEEENYDSSPLFETSYSLEIYGREWTFDAQTTQLFEKYTVSKQPIVILVSGLIINGLILAAFLLLSNAKRRAEQEVIEKTAELNMQKQEAESAVKVKAAFLANMSHEIRTPMNAIIGMLVLLKDAQLNDYSRRLVGKAFNASEVLLQLLNDILDLSRIEADHIELNFQPFGIEALIQRSVELFAIVAEEKGLKLRVNIAPSTPKCVTGDLLRISQICSNLVGNAIKFTHQGSVSVSVGFSNITETRGLLKVTVKDTGIGIREEDQQRVFENFRQADESTSREFGGSGLGLAISSHLAHLMDATLTVESAENKGSKFTLVVPVEIAENEPSIGTRHISSPIQVHHYGLNHNLALLKAYREHWSLELIPTTTLKQIKSILSDAPTAESATPSMAIIDMENIEVSAVKAFTLELLSADEQYQLARLLIIVPAGFQSDWLIEYQNAGGKVAFEPLTPSKLFEHLAPKQLAEHTVNSGPRPLFHNLNALIVDDVQLNCEIVASYLNSFGVDSVSVHNGVQAMQQLETQSFDLVLMDLHLDGETGQDIVRQIRSHQSLTQPVIAALSASISEHDRSTAYEAGMNDYLTKPVLPGDIQRLLQSFFQEHALAASAHLPAHTVKQPGHDGLPGFISRPVYQDMFGANPELFNRCLRSFLASSKEMTADIERCMRTEDAAMTKAVAHRIRGAAANIANTELQRLAERVENGSDSGEPSAGPEALLTTLTEHVRQLRETALATDHPAISDSARSEPIDQIIERMNQRLGSNRIAADTDIDQVLAYLNENDLAGLSLELRGALETYKFGQAIDLLAKINIEIQGRSSDELE